MYNTQEYDVAEMARQPDANLSGAVPVCFPLRIGFGGWLALGIRGGVGGLNLGDPRFGYAPRFSLRVALKS